MITIVLLILGQLKFTLIIINEKSFLVHYWVCIFIILVEEELLQIYPSGNGAVDQTDPYEYDYQEPYGDRWMKRAGFNGKNWREIAREMWVPRKRLRNNQVWHDWSGKMKFGKRRNISKNKKQEHTAVKYFPILFA